MLRTLLVGVDGSHDSEAALSLAVRWASPRNALIVGFGCVDEPGVRSPGDFLFGEELMRNINTTILAEESARVENSLTLASRRCVIAGVAFKPLEDTGSPHVRLLEEAQRYDLIMLGRETHFRFGFEDGADTTLGRVLAAGSRPVIAVPEDKGDHGTVLVAYDGSSQAARALSAFVATGLGRGRELLVACVDRIRQDAARTAERAIDYLKFHELNAKAQPIASERAVDEVLLETARTHDATLIVMGAYGKSAVRDFFLGSATRSLINKSPIPLFLFH